VKDEVKEPKDIFYFTLNSQLANIVISKVIEESFPPYYDVSFYHLLNNFFPYEQYLIYKYLSSPPDSSKVINPEFTNSICYNLGAFVYQGEWIYQKNRESLFWNIDDCIRAIEKKWETKRISGGCGKINILHIKRVHKILTNYLNIAEKVYKKQLIPIFFNLCYKECLCQDIGIKCSQTQERNSRHIIEETISTLVYEALYKKVLFNVQFIPTIPNTIKTYTDLLQSYNCKDILEYPKYIEAEKEKLIQLIEKVPKSAGVWDYSTIFEVKNAIKSNQLTEGFSLLKKLPKTFLDVTSSQQFYDTINNLAALVNIPSFETKLLQNKDICSGIYLASLAILFKEKNEDMTKNVLTTLTKNDLEGLLFLLEKEINLKQLTGEEQLPDIQLAHLPYYLYKSINLYKLTKCFSWKLPSSDEEELKNFEKYIPNYQKIFNDENLYLEPLFKDETLLKELLKDEKVTLYTIEAFLKKIDLKPLSEVSEKFKQICNSQEKEKCYNFFMTGASTLRSNVEALCNNNLYKNIADYFPEPLPQCPTSSSYYCFTLIMQNLGGMLIQQYELKIKDEKVCQQQCKIIYDNLSPLWNMCCSQEGMWSSKEISIAGNEIKGARNYLYANIEACCKNYALYCSQIFISGALVAAIEREIESHFGRFYLELMKNKMKDFKKLWKEKDKCSSE
jgi:hypothetical protein